MYQKARRVDLENGSSKCSNLEEYRCEIEIRLKHSQIYLGQQTMVGSDKCLPCLWVESAEDEVKRNEK